MSEPPIERPGRRFFLFGMGGRRKLLYKDGALTDLFSGECLGRWDLGRDRISAPEYKVEISTAGGSEVRIFEDTEAVWLQQGSTPEPISRSRLALPDFADHPCRDLLRVLHQEILINIVPAGPVPNLLAYPRPWYRDAATMCMALARTGNLHLVSDWIGGLREPFDRNNAGNLEPDNLGQALYLLSLASDAGHPLVQTILRTAREFRRERHIVGVTDGAEHPVYQTKWLKFGLQGLGLDDPYEIPPVFDSYSALFWMDFRDAHVPGPRFNARQRNRYPYLAWAEHHFHGDMSAELPDPAGYPLTWEAHAGQADYAAMGVASAEYVRRKVAAPHAWHAAEMFLYLLKPDPNPG